MFNKSILAAALLTVGTIAGGSAVSAAEIGVRSSHGFTNRHIEHGRSLYVRTVDGSYSEYSAGVTRSGRFFGSDFSSSGYVRSDSGDVSEVARESYNFTGNSRNSFSELSTFSR